MNELTTTLLKGPRTLTQLGTPSIQGHENSKATHRFDSAHVDPSPDAGFASALC